MGLKITDRIAFSWPVTVQVPDDGRHRACRITVRYAALTQSALDALLADAVMPDAAILREVVTGWEGIEDETGDALAFCDDALARLVDIPFVRTAMVRAYFEGVTGVAEKN